MVIYRVLMYDLIRRQYVIRFIVTRSFAVYIIEERESREIQTARFSYIFKLLLGGKRTRARCR